MHRKPWYELSREEQDLYLRLLWEDGHSEQAIADFFSTTKGPIVRRRQTDLKLPTGNRPVVKGKVDPERFRDLVDLHAMAELEKKGVAVLAPIGTCQWPLSTGRSLRSVPLCGKPVVPGKPVCEEHLGIITRMLASNR